MFVQQRHAAEGPRAGATLVLLHLRVGLQVGTQVGAVRKGPVTVVAGEWSLTSVCAYMSSEEPGSGEGLPTCGAHAGQGV